MAVPAKAPEHAPIGGVPSQPAIALLADRANRTIVATLAAARGRGVTAAQITDRSPLDVAPRLIRDRLRALVRAGVVGPAPPPPGLERFDPAWVLTPAGEDLHRLDPIISRIATRASGRTVLTHSTVRDQITEATLSAMADPVVLQIVRCLTSAGPLGPVELEALCAPTPRRTLYRRLTLLVDGGAVARKTSGQVPRSTVYALEDRWRPASAIILLAGWWQGRHAGRNGPLDEFDLEGLVLSVLPSIRPAGLEDGGALDWVVSADGSPQRVIRLEVVSDRLQVGGPFGDADGTGRPTTRSTGSPTAWSAALVTDRRDALTTQGDAGLADAVLTAVRSALLAYVR